MPTSPPISRGINRLIHISRRDVLLGVLPMFHCYGYTATLWTALTLDALAVYHHTPLEPRQIGGLCRKHGGTILIATPTFLRSYLRRCEPEDLRTLEVVFAGAEKLPPELAAAFHERFGVLPVEGYGATELSPVVAGNMPAFPRSLAGQVRQPPRHDRPADRGRRGEGDRPGKRARTFPAAGKACCWFAAPA